MKIAITLTFAILFAFNSNANFENSNATINQQNSVLIVPKSETKFKSVKKKSKFSKDVWSIIELDQKINAPIFYPYNEKTPGFDQAEMEMRSELFEK